MDPETTRLVVTVAGTLIAAAIGQFGGYRIAQANVGGQRRLAADNARREYRLRQVQPLLDRASRRLARYRTFILAGVDSDKSRLQEAWSHVLEEDPLAEISYVASLVRSR